MLKLKAQSTVSLKESEKRRLLAPFPNNVMNWMSSLKGQFTKTMKKKPFLTHTYCCQANSYCFSPSSPEDIFYRDYLFNSVDFPKSRPFTSIILTRWQTSSKNYSICVTAYCNITVRREMWVFIILVNQPFNPLLLRADMPNIHWEVLSSMYVTCVIRFHQVRESSLIRPLIYTVCENTVLYCAVDLLHINKLKMI